jgi:hypothetical protein
MYGTTNAAVIMLKKYVNSLCYAQLIVISDAPCPLKRVFNRLLSGN